MRADPTILLVEDNPAHAELIIRTLGGRRPGRIIHVRDGEAALDFVFRRKAYADPAGSPTPDLILLDLRLPRVDGMEVLRAIKNSPDYRWLPVVVLIRLGVRLMQTGTDHKDHS